MSTPVGMVLFHTFISEKVGVSFFSLINRQQHVILL